MAPPWQFAKPKRHRRLLEGLTGNALVTALISAIVAGVISFAVAHYQVQDTDRQAVASQQVAVAGQVEAAATEFYKDTFPFSQQQMRCGLGIHGACQVTSDTSTEVISANFM
jgi:Tfp pilus assembly protein PilV